MKSVWRLYCMIMLLAFESQALPEVAKQNRRISKIRTTIHTEKRNQKRRKSSANASTKTIENEVSKPPISVQAILIPRSIKIQFLIRLCCIGLTIISLLQCLKTAGYPHVQTIWKLVNGNIPMPPTYLPSSLDIQLAHIMAASSRDLIPPISLPSTGALLGIVVSALGYISTLLLPRWFTQVRVASDYRQVMSASASSLDEKAGTSVLLQIEGKKLKHDMASISQESDGKSSLICTLQPSLQNSKKKKKRPINTRLGLDSDHPSQHFFDFNQCRFYFDADSMACSDGGPVLHTAPIRDLKELVAKGITKRQRVVATERYRPYNEPKLASPTIQEAFYARISSPLVLVQLLGRLLSCLEEGVQSLVNTATTVSQHYFNARQSIRSAKQLAVDVQTSLKDTASIKVMRLTPGAKKKWISTTASELIPGDIFLLPQAQNFTEFVIPVDALLLDGQCLTNEAVLTGESVPQSKRAIDFDEELIDDDTCLDMQDHQSSILFAGTTLIHSTATSSLRNQNLPFPSPKKSGMLCLALRTGTYSSKGQLLRALKSSTHIGAISNSDSEKDAFRLIASLSVFALATCISLFIPKGNDQESVPAYRRVMQCTRIACASIPSDLPLMLSTVTKSCSQKLREESDVVCSDAGSLLTCAYVDTVVFDKTGTLTADTQALSKLITKIPGFNTMTTRQYFQRFALAGSHSLVNLGARPESQKTESALVGDPLDLAALDFSGWNYNATDDSYCLNDTNSTKPSDPTQLWQIKSFPFDSRKRLSTALVLAKHADNSYRVWSLTKGSPDSILALFSLRHDPAFKESYSKKKQELESQGYRSIAIGSLDLSNSSLLVDRLFPNGLSCTTDAIVYAKSQGTSLHRSDFEVISTNSTITSGLDFSGFACFDASLRPSSKRIIGELQRGGIKSIMLTGDAIDAALAVSRKVGLIKEREIAILETVDNNGSGDLRWRLVKLKAGKKSSFKDFHKTARSETFTSSSVTRILKLQKNGQCAIAATGQALESVFDEISDDAREQLVNNLSCVSVIARATPALKQSVITCLKHRCGQKVMMCGDGVNDVAAMKAADVAVALLNGFGSEEKNGIQNDIDDERRSKKLEAKKIGSNRQGRKPSQRNSSQNRMRARIEKAREDIDRRRAKSDSTEYNMQDIKDIVSTTLSAAKEERRRAKSLKMGGGDAARILAEERRNLTETDTDKDMGSSAIKPGEASLVASFSCLHPSIDGVEAILRAGVATAASVLASKKIIALQSLMSAYHLASLYRDGFRYGKNMWPVELYMWIFVDAARYSASCTSRPRLPSSISFRPSPSMFHPSCIFPTVAQAGIHLLSMTIGVNYARQLEAKGTDKKKSSIRLSNAPHPAKAGMLLSALAARDWGAEESDDNGEQQNTGLLRRPAFRANYETNAVFIFSILQSAIVNVLNHDGKPFYRSILESRELGFISLLTMVFSLALVLESFPLINRLLELRPLPSLKSKFTFLGIATLNVGACVFCQLLSDTWFREKIGKYPVRKRKERNAADMEEDLLREESKENLKLVFLAVGFGAFLVVDMIAKHSR